MKIDITSIPVEPFVSVYDGENNLIIYTNNVTTFSYIRSQIKEHGMTGCYLVTQTGQKIDIDYRGRILGWPDDKSIPGDVYEDQLRNLLNV